MKEYVAYIQAKAISIGVTSTIVYCTCVLASLICGVHIRRC